MPKPLTSAEREIAKKFKKLMHLRNQGKLLYAESDKIADELLKELPDPTKTFRLVRSAKKLGHFRDNFADSNTCFRSHGIKKFEPEVVEKPS